MKCWNCGVDTSLRKCNPDEYLRRKVANALASVKKAKANGTKMGPPQKFDRVKVRFLRREGHSMSTIATMLGVHKSAIWRALKQGS
jgi:DNA invertase Pin-like site-specific DNA recombinase